MMIVENSRLLSPAQMAEAQAMTKIAMHGSDEDLRRYRYRIAGALKPQPVAVRVKPLEWRHDDLEFCVTDFVDVSVYIQKYAEKSSPFCLYVPNCADMHFDTLDDAKAAAEAENVARVMAWISL